MKEVEQTYNSSTQEVEAEDQKFKVILGYRVSSRQGGLLETVLRQKNVIDEMENCKLIKTKQQKSNITIWSTNSTTLPITNFSFSL